MEPIQKKAANWTAENIASFWDWYSKNAGKQKNYFTAVLAPGIANFLKNKNLLKGAVLDYGCGSGHLLLQMVKETGTDFYGLDFSTESVAATEKKLQHATNIKQLVKIDQLPSPFADAMFNSITLIETIEHLQDDTLRQTMDEIYRVLKSKGKLFITTPFNEDLDSHMSFCPFCKSEFHHMQHMQSFTIENITALAKEHRFIVDYCDNIDIEKFRLGTIKYFIKKVLKKIVIATGIKENEILQKPNLVAIFSKP
ncbi:MAG: hypothetical protein RIS73_658 [Bacteroidota bacterium]|jgi:ubiquinone/menaquinone biosynthesis C-methylase UbiE